MVKRSTELALRAALDEARRSWKVGNKVFTVQTVCRMASVSRATANRDAVFITEFRNFAAEMKRSEQAHPDDRRRRIPREDTVALLRTKLSLMATVIASLSVAVAERDESIKELRRHRSDDKSTPESASRAASES